MDTTLLQALVALAVGALLILAGIAVVHILDSIKANATPSVQVILAALYRGHSRRLSRAS